MKVVIIMSVMCRQLIHKAIHIELHQIKHLAMLATMAPNEVARQMILHMIKEETGEAMFWNTVDAAYRISPAGVAPLPGVAPCPGAAPFPGGPVLGGGMGPGMGMGPVPGILPPVGPESTLPPSVPIGGGSGTIFFPESEKDKK